MKKPETKFKERVQADLKKLKNCWALKIQQVAIRGIPDFLICLCGRFVAIELKKSSKEEPNTLQKWTLEMIAAKGGMCFVANPENWTATFEVLKELDNQFNDMEQIIEEEPLN